jgi:hypothetical protein
MISRVPVASGWMEFGRERVIDDRTRQRKRLLGSSKMVDTPMQSEIHEFLDERYVCLDCISHGFSL